AEAHTQGMQRRQRSRTAAARWSQLTAAAALTGFVLAVYAVIVLGGGALIGSTTSASLPLSVLATAVVALAFEPVRRRSQTGAARLFRRSGFSPYEVLSHFSDTVTGGYGTEEPPERMARLLLEGTDAEWAQVWLMVQGQLVQAGSWPPGTPDGAAPVPHAGARDGSAQGRRALTVRYGGQVYGVFRLQERPGVPLSSVEERLFTGLAAQAGLVLRLAGLRADLAARHDDLARRTSELRSSRERLIAAQDDERRRLERDIHDGAQQHLVALAVNLRLVEVVLGKDPERARGLLAAQADATRAAIETLSRLARGMYPSHLSDEGLAAALRAGVAAAPVPVSITGDFGARWPEHVEAALYFFAMEAVQNAAKHASASSVRVEVSDGQVTVTDDGAGFVVDETRGSGLANMRDRLDAVGGSIHLDSVVGRGTTVTATVPALAGAAT
ncbi:MAG: putative Histidine kinase, partial [Frankiales bacterium]|nr:putative Histidine kinase [Frankiales bacterium]